MERSFHLPPLGEDFEFQRAIELSLEAERDAPFLLLRHPKAELFDDKPSLEAVCALFAIPALSVQPSPQTQLVDAIEKKLLASGSFEAQWKVLVDVFAKYESQQSQYSTDVGRFCEDLVKLGGRYVLMRNLPLQEDVFLKVYGTSSRLMDLTLSSLSRSELFNLFEPIFLGCAKTLFGSSIRNQAHQKALGRLHSFVTNIGAARVALSHIMEDEMENKIKLEPFYQIGGLSPLFSLIVSLESEEPLSYSPLDRKGIISMLQRHLEQAYAMHKDIVQALLRDKINAFVKDSLIRWFIFTLRKEQWLAPLRSVSSPSLTLILVTLCEPFFALDSKAHQNFQRLDVEWLRASSRIPSTSHRCLGLQRKEGNSSSTHLDFEMEDDEARALAEALALSMGRETKVDSTSKELHSPTNENFHFVTDCFFLALRSSQLYFAPTLKAFHDCEQAQRRTIDIHSSAGLPIDQVLALPQVAAINRALDSFDAILIHEPTSSLMIRFAVLTIAWFRSLLSRPESEVKEIFSFIPEAYLKNALECVKHLIATMPDVFVATPSVESLVAGLIDIIGAPVEAIRNTILRQNAADILVDLTTGRRPPSCALADGVRLENLVSLNAYSYKVLISRLIALYHDVGYVEGATEVFDKNSARGRIGTLLKHLLSIPGRYYTESFYAVFTTSAWPDFVKDLLSDTLFMFNDALSRINDVKEVQLRMKDTTLWSALPATERTEAERYYHQVESTATSFLYFATIDLGLITFLAEDVTTRQAMCTAALRSIAQNLMIFLDKLCGTRIKELKVDNAAKYHWDPKALLRLCGLAVACFASCPGFVECAVEFVDDESLFSRARRLLTEKVGVGFQTEGAFTQLVQAMEAKMASRALHAPSYSSFPFDETSLPPEADYDGVRVEYVSLLADHMYGEACYSSPSDDDTPTYASHHYKANILKSEGADKTKLARLVQEHTALAAPHALPLDPNAAIFLRRDEDRFDVCKVLITGPVDTPYAGGLFEFHVFCPDSYPESPPLVNLETTGNNTVRFNPNLYSCGKVCLSLLGTWHGGAKTEGWTRDSSTLLQVLVSIQSLILVKDPFFNEPGYESQMGTENGNIQSERYNDERRVQTIRLAMNGMIKHPPNGFDDVVTLHFKILGPQLIRQCDLWARNAHARFQKNPNEKNFAPDILRELEEFKSLLAKLK